MPSADQADSLALERIAEADDVFAVRAALSEALALAGIPAAYFLAPLTSDARVGRILTSLGNSRIWERHYRSYLYRVDPLPNFSLSVSGAFFWPDALEQVTIDERERRYLEIAGKFGLGRGVGVACYGPQGRSGFLGASWPHPEKPEVNVLQWVNNVGQTSFQRYCQLVRMDDTVPALSNRELEVLSWMCDGKSNSVIAQILDISRSSVDMYVRRLFNKLNVTDRTAACIRGFTLGLVLGRDHQHLIEQTLRREPGNAI
ncbi:LuxR family transcriptional regulator [Aurantiacibacter xanthus]|uniref:LuxR family transcriptional regulator n=1 Tax=Aurantiacibacter xanthus TaxID=1784712 RepID=A0A3A1PA74_9SPHN|nr:LuxR family transcriptional regulator [Aurantiacibacter xanthus]RIV90644.1 LuxR family transcriptional regulator [Aurantiacibacter xanthus]